MMPEINITVTNTPSPHGFMAMTYHNLKGYPVAQLKILGSLELETRDIGKEGALVLMKKELQKFISSEKPTSPLYQEALDNLLPSLLYLYHEEIRRILNLY